MTETAKLALIFVAAGLVFVGFGVPLARGRVPPNAWYGCRTHATLSDEEVWYAVNRVTGRDMIATGVAVAIAALAVLAFGRGMDADVSAFVLLSVLVLGVARMAFHGLKGSRRA